MSEDELDIADFEELTEVKPGQRKTRFDYDAIVDDLCALGARGTAVTMRKIEDVMREHEATHGMIHYSQKKSLVDKLVYDPNVRVLVKDGFGRGKFYMFVRKTVETETKGKKSKKRTETAEAEEITEV